jgi:hypothetical protein
MVSNGSRGHGNGAPSARTHSSIDEANRETRRQTGNTNAQNFHLEEYKQIRAEVIGLLGRVEQLFRYSIVVSASVTAWLLTSTLGANAPDVVCVKVPRDIAALGWLIAPAFVLTSGMMAGVTMYRVLQMGRYLRRLERFLGRRHLGWEQFQVSKPWIVTVSTALVWLVLFAAASGAAYAAFPKAKNASVVCGSNELKSPLVSSVGQRENLNRL